MIFGTRKSRTALGQFTSEKCTSCEKSKEYIFYKVTKFIVVLFVNLIPIGTSYEADCTKCDDTLAIDKKAGKKISKTKFSEENSNQNFIVFLKLFVAALIIAAAVVLPIIFVRPPTSPQLLKNLVEQDGQYTILDKNEDVVCTMSVSGGISQLIVYDDTSRYKSAQGEVFTMHKKYEEIVTADGSYLSPIADDFGSLVDINGIKVQRYYYDIANSSYGYFIGVDDLSTIEYSDGKTVYPIKFYNTETDIINFKLLVFNDDSREMHVRYVIYEDGSEELVDIQVIDKTGGRKNSETKYVPNTQSNQINFIGAVNSDSNAQAFTDFIMNNALTVEYVEAYEYYKDTTVITSIVTSIYDGEGNMTVDTANYEVTLKDGYYILVKDVLQP